MSQPNGLLTEKDLGPRLRRLARLSDDLRRGKVQEADILAEFKPPPPGAAPRAAAAAWFVRALALNPLARKDEARRALQAAVDAYWRFPKAHLLLANLDLAARRVEAAEKRLRATVGMSPGCEPALLALGDIAQRQGQPERAQRWYQQAVKHHPESLLARERKARVHVALKQLPAALEEAKLIRKLEGEKSVRFYALVAQIYMAAGDLVAACQALEKGVEVCDASARAGFLRRLLGWYRLAANITRMSGTIDRLLAIDGLAAVERKDLEEMKKEIGSLDEAAFLVWNFRWQVRAVRDPQVPPEERATALNFCCHIRRSALGSHLGEALRKELDLLWRSALDAVSRSSDAPPIQLACVFLAEHPDPAVIPMLARLVHPSRAPARARRAAVPALDAVWRPALLPLLLQCMQDPDTKTAAAAARVLRERLKLDAKQDLRRWAATAAGRERLAAAVDPTAPGSLWDLAVAEGTARPALCRAVMPILRSAKADPEAFINAYLFLERNVDYAGWRKGKRRVDPVLDNELPDLAAAIERWYGRGAEAFTWKGEP